MMRFCLRPTLNPARVVPFVEQARLPYATIPKRIRPKMALTQSRLPSLRPPGYDGLGLRPGLSEESN
jgi:hypothetical protein